MSSHATSAIVKINRLIFEAAGARGTVQRNTDHWREYNVFEVYDKCGVLADFR